jgi:hypothetical protein
MAYPLDQEQQCEGMILNCDEKYDSASSAKKIMKSKYSRREHQQQPIHVTNPSSIFL